MKDLNSNPYPGANAGPTDIILLAEEYRSAAGVLMANARAGEPLSRAPARLCAIHAIELYLNALLLHAGARPQEVRAQLHDLAERAERAQALGIVFRERTRAHLHDLMDKREYLVSRYGPDVTTRRSEANRLMPTLEEVASKVKSKVDFV